MVPSTDHRQLTIVLRRLDALLRPGLPPVIADPAEPDRAVRRLAAMSAAERTQAEDLLERTASGAERRHLLAAVAAGDSGAVLARFADTIRGRSAGWLAEHLTLLDRGRAGRHQRFGALVNQCDGTTCGTTSLIVTRAGADPRYVLGLTEGIEDLRDGRARQEEFDRRFCAEQDRVHDQTNTIYPKALGTSPMGMARWLNRHAGATGTTYRYRFVADTDQRDIGGALLQVIAAVSHGYPVPLLLGGVYPAHYVTVVGYRDSHLLVFEPGRGITTWISAAAFVAGNLREAVRFDHVQAVIVPRDGTAQVQ